ncbi:MAG TPA: LacI family DNA-binding transcriptional regulator [Dongiaceae bacterium]|jgi:LacI family transcriptional regulator
MAGVKGRKNARAQKLAQPGRATIRDVADAAGVSPMTVSNLINERSGTMRAETRQRIQTEIKRLGYRPHAMARSLRLARQLSIGMIIIDEEPHYLADPFTTHIVAGLSNQLNSRGYGLLLQGVAPDAFPSSSLIRGISSDAICIMMSGPDSVRRGIVEAVLALGQPLVVFQDILPFRNADICLIRQADDEGGRMVADEVLGLGARKLIMLVPAVQWPAITERVKGVRKAVRSRGASAALRIVECGDAELDDTQAALNRDIAAHGLPDAIIAGNDQMGIAAMKLMAVRKLKVPKDIVITGFNAFEFAQYTSPVLTTVRSPAYELGARGGVEILHRLEKGRFSQAEIVYPVALQKGGST